MVESHPSRPLARFFARTAVALAFLLVPAAIGASCSSDLAPAELAAACTLNTDCAKPLVCAFQLCHQQCNSSRDCPAGERCVTSDRPFDVCQLGSESSCTYNSQCPVGKMCASNGQCRDQCTTSRDCVMDQLCVTGVCADPVDITATGLLVGTPADGGSGATCVRNSDCGDAGLVCLQGSCQVQCLADIDCLPPAGPGGTCIASVCVPKSNTGTTLPVPDASIPPGAPAGYGQTCNLPSDCPLGLKCGNAGQCVYACNADFDCQLSGEGTCCNSHRCLTGAACLQDAGDGGPAASDAGICATSCVSNAGCDDGVYCNGVERCLGGCCAPASDTPCNSHSACIAIACTESTKSCGAPVHLAAGEDLDGDGHLSVGCLGGDDCDDADPAVYPGHAEYFDGKDNDCNGLVDDWTSHVKGPTEPTGTTLAVPVGGASGGWLMADFAASAQTTVTPYSATWQKGAPVVNSMGTSTYTPIGAASEANTALFAMRENWGTGALDACIFGVNGSLKGCATLTASYSPSWVNNFDAVWGGSAYIAGWWESSYAPYYALVDANANLLGVHSLPAIYSNHVVRVAGNGASLAVAYQRSADAMVVLELLNNQGGLNDTAVISAATDGSVNILAVAGAPSAYVVLWSHDAKTYATYVPVLPGLLLSPAVRTVIADPLYVPTFAWGAFDGVGAAFLVQYAQGSSFGYLNGSMKNPFELGNVAAGAVPNFVAGGTGGRLGLSYVSGSTNYARQAGFCSLPGADCTQANQCCSGTCTASFCE